MNTRIAILGRGRMGREIQSCLEESDGLQLAGIWVRNKTSLDSGAECPESDSLASVLSSADVAVDFTLPAVSDQIIDAVLVAKVPLVCGVSGLTDSSLQHMAEAAARIAILYDRNMSLGVAVLQKLVHLAGAALGNRFEAEIHETHHVHKIDAPSGTALQLGETLAASRGQNFAEVYHYAKDGRRTAATGNIHFEVSRRDEVPGEHSVLFRSANESLSLTHKVADRRVFAVGALEAARWLVTQAPGLYSLQDMLVDASG